MTILEVIIINKSDVHAKSQGLRSKNKVKELKSNFTQIWVFWPETPVLNSQMATKLCTKLEMV